LKINSFFKDGKYDDDIAMPLIDLYNNTSKSLSKINEPPDLLEIEKNIAIIKADKEGLPTSIEDIFINTMVSRRGDVLKDLQQKNKDVYESFSKLVSLVNKKINKKILGEEEEEDFLSALENMELFDELENMEL
jgi:GTPase SAR1 family protein